MRQLTIHCQISTKRAKQRLGSDQLSGTERYFSRTTASIPIAVLIWNEYLENLEWPKNSFNSGPVQ